MSQPTLFREGSLVQTDATPQEVLDTLRPIDHILAWFSARSQAVGVENRLLVLKAQTGSGKSIGLPAEIYKKFVQPVGGKNAPGVICTQPRVITAIENVGEIQLHYGFRRGTDIGWSTKHNKLRPFRRGLLSATIGTLLQELQYHTDSEIAARYRFILVDEVHTRDLATDTALSLLKRLLTRMHNNINCPFVVLMSATIDPIPFLRYFGLATGENKPNFIYCRGESHPIEERWDWNDGRLINDYSRAAATVVGEICGGDASSDRDLPDILIFAPGSREIVELKRALAALNEKLGGAFALLAVDSNAVREENDDYRATISKDKTVHTLLRGKNATANRRVIIATNVAETGLTLHRLGYVIDCGYSREMEYDPETGARGLITKPATVDKILQRRGRVGRKGPGVFYPLYPRFIFDKLQKCGLPSVLLEEVCSVLWQQMLSDDFVPEQIDMLDAPTTAAIDDAVERLYACGFCEPPAANQEEHTLIRSGPIKLTELGKIAVVFSTSIGLSPECARMILAGYQWNFSIMELIAIAAYLKSEPQHMAGASTKHSDDEHTAKKGSIGIDWTGIYKHALPAVMAGDNLYYRTKVLFCDGFIDGLLLYIAAMRAAEQGDLEAWCESYGVAYSSLMNFIALREELVNELLLAGLRITDWDSKPRSIGRANAETLADAATALKHCILDGFGRNLLTLRDGGYYTRRGVLVSKPEIISENERSIFEAKKYGVKLVIEPKYLLYNQLRIKYVNPKKGATNASGHYVYLCDAVSMMDGWCAIDPRFMQ
jgi:HrpA-like RNA helicase